MTEGVEASLIELKLKTKGTREVPEIDEYVGMKVVNLDKQRLIVDERNL